MYVASGRVGSVIFVAVWVMFCCVMCWIGSVLLVNLCWIGSVLVKVEIFFVG